MCFSALLLSISFSFYLSPFPSLSISRFLFLPSFFSLSVSFFLVCVPSVSLWCLFLSNSFSLCLFLSVSSYILSLYALYFLPTSLFLSISIFLSHCARSAAHPTSLDHAGQIGALFQ
uniref:Uncharacterized protein n=1 Tax=Rhipicephalus pulchellus TaxID=72859 RepID=L7LSN5_RHIPC